MHIGTSVLEFGAHEVARFAPFVVDMKNCCMEIVHLSPPYFSLLKQENSENNYNSWMKYGDILYVF